MTFFEILCAILAALLLGTAWSLSYVSRGRGRMVATVLLLLVDGAALAGFFLGARHPDWHLADWAYLGPTLQVLTVVFMFQLVLFVLVVLALFVRSMYRHWHRPVPFDASRRRLLQRAAVYPVAAFGAGLYGEGIERHQLAVRHYDIPVAGLPAQLAGLRIAQLSDVHLGMFYSLADLRELLTRAVAARPDLLAITGDLFDDNKINLEAVHILAEYTDQFPLGIWFCPGNHEHFRNWGETQKALRETDVHVLVNQAEPVAGLAPLWLVGVDYPMNRPRFAQDKAAFTDQAFAAVPEDAVVLFLAHHPEFIDDGAARGAALTLTGHTHGSQFGFLGIPVFPVFKYTRGIVRIGGHYGYVHSGNGSWFPCRIGCPPELAVFTLQQA